MKQPERVTISLTEAEAAQVKKKRRKLRDKDNKRRRVKLRVVSSFQRSIDHHSTPHSAPDTVTQLAAPQTGFPGVGGVTEACSESLSKEPCSPFRPVHGA